MSNFAADIFEAQLESEGLSGHDLDNTDWETSFEEWADSVTEWMGEQGVDVDRMADETPRGHEPGEIAYHTATGAGVGLWEDEFAPYFRDADHCKAVCEGLRAFADEIETALDNAVWAAVEGAPTPPASVLIDGELAETDGETEIDVHVSLNEERAYLTGARVGWCNSARIAVEPHMDRVSVAISVGDPRGALVMSVERIDGELYLSVPDPSDSFPHVKLTQVGPGRFKVGE